MLSFIFIFLALVFFDVFIIDFSRFRMLHFSQPVPPYKNEEINFFLFLLFVFPTDNYVGFRDVIKHKNRCLPIVLNRHVPPPKLLSSGPLEFELESHIKN